MRNKSSAARATKTVASPSGQASSRTPVSARTNGVGKSRPNSTVRQSSLEPYHDIAASVFTINDTAELETMFLAAARDGDFAQIEALLRRRNDLAYSIDIRDTKTGNTAIIWAAKRGHYKIVELLLRHGADVTLRNYDGQTAVEVGSSVIARLILDSVSSGGPHRNLLQAAWQGDSVLVQKILSENRVDINCRNSDGLTPLLLVTRDIQLFDRIGDKITKPYNPVDVVTELLAYRADPNVEDGDGRSPLHYVSSSRAPVCGKLTEILLHEGADIEKRDRRCFTPIHCAAQSGNVDVVVALLTGGSEANSRGFAGTTPLHISAVNGNAQVISKLLSYGADVRLVDDGGLTCVDVAKTKRVKAALKEAWSEVMQAKSPDLSPVKMPSAVGLRRSSQSNSVRTMTQNHTKKTGGEVIFDLREAWRSQNFDSARRNNTFQRPLPAPTAESITPRRASTIASIERHLSLAEQTMRSEEQLYKELASGSMSNRGRTPSSVARSPTAGRKLTPIKAHNPPWKSKRDVKFGLGTKHHDGVTSQGLKKSSSDLAKNNTESLALRVTVIGLDLDDNLQENRGNRLPTSRVLSNRLAQQYHQPAAPNIADVSNFVDEFYLRGRSSSKASLLTISDDYDDQTHPTSTSPPRLTPIRTPSASDRNRGLRIPTTINEGETGGVGYMLNLGRSSSKASVLTISDDYDDQTHPTSTSLPRLTPIRTPSASDRNRGLRIPTTINEGETGGVGYMLNLGRSSSKASVLTISDDYDDQTHPTSTSLPRLTPIRTPSASDRNRGLRIPTTINEGETGGVGYMLNLGRSSSKASLLTISDDYDDQTHPTSTSPPRLTPIRTPSASDRNRGLRIPTTINEGETGGVGYMLNLGRSSSKASVLTISDDYDDQTHPTSTSLPRLTPIRTPSASDRNRGLRIPTTINEGETGGVGYMLNLGRSSSKASVLTISDDYDDQTHPTSTSPPRLTPIRTPSASDRNRGLRIPTTINEGETGGVGYMLNLDHHMNNAPVSSVKSNSTLYMFSNQHKVLPCTPTCLPPDGTDMRLVDCSQDFSCKGDSPRLGTNTMKEGDFNIEETRIRNSDDSGIPEDKNSSKSSSVSSSVSNLSPSSLILPDIEDRTTLTGNHGRFSPRKETKSVNDMKKSQSDSSLGRQADNSKGAIKNVDSVKLKQIARDNAVMNQQKHTTKSGISSSNLSRQGKTVTAENSESAENTNSKTDHNNSSKDFAQASTEHSSVSEKNSQASNLNRRGELSQKCVPPNVKTSPQSVKSGSTAAACAHDGTKAGSQGVGRPWNASTNLKSINTRSGNGSGSSNSRPPVPPKPSALLQMSTVDKDEASPAAEVSKVIVEDMESEQLCNNQEKCDKNVSQGSKLDTNKTTDSNVTASKRPTENVNKCRSACNNVAKAKSVTSNTARSVANDRSVGRTKKNDNNMSKPKNASHGPVSTSRPTNTKPQPSPTAATKTNPSRVVSKQNMPKTSDNTPVRPPRKSQIQKANSVDHSSLTKRATSNHPNEKEAATKDSITVLVEESKSETEHQPTPSLVEASNSAANGMKVEEVEVSTNTLHSSKTRTEISHGAKQQGASMSATAEVCITSKSKPSLVTSSNAEGSPSPGEVSSVSANVKQIQVMPYHEQVAPSQYEGPVIIDIFEPLHQERKLAEQQQNEDAKSREKGAVKHKQVIHPKKTKTPDVRVTSAGGRTKRSLKSASSDRQNDRQKRQQTRKVKKKKAKKTDKEDLMLTDRPEKKEAEGKSSACISGKGWYIHAECNDNKDVHGVRINNVSDDSDDDTTWVQPNYISDDADDGGGDILTTSVHRSDNSLRHSWEKKCIPGQIHGDDSEDDLVQDEVFTIGSTSDESPGTTSRDILDITEEATSAEPVFRSSKPNQKPGFQNITVKGTSDIALEQPHGIMPQVSEAIAEFSRQVSGLELDELLEGVAGSHVSENPSCGELEPDSAKDNKSCSQCTVIGSDSTGNKSAESSSGNKLDKNHNSESQDSKCDDLPNSERSKSTGLVQNKVIRHTEGFKAPKVQQNKPEKSKSDDEEISEMINEILKSTPDPSLNLSWKSRSENSSISKTGKGTPKRLALVQSLDDSQNCSFKQIPNDKPEERSAFRPQPVENEEEEIQTLQKLVNTYKNMPLHVERAKGKGQTQDQGTVSLPKGKPPVPPKTSASAKPTTSQPMKSPRFVRKHDSIKGMQHRITMSRDTDSLGTASEFDTASLPIDDQDTLVPSDRAETVTSRLGRHNSAGRPASSMTNSSEDVETIQWKRGNLLGKGAYGKVWRGLTNAGELIAVKQIELNIDDMEKAEREYEKIQEEVDLLKTLNHQNIVGYLGTSLEDNIVSIFMQFVPGGSICNLISLFGALEEEVFCRYTKQILQGVQYLHSNNVIHRDIKGGNIMVMQNGVIKLIDFGCAKRLYLNVTSSLNSCNKEQLLKSMRGTPYWMAPEVVREEGHGTKSDIWSIGCTVFEMATKNPPWANEPPYAAIFAIGNDAQPVPTLPEKFSPDARKFVGACLTRDQRKRPSAADLLLHPFIQKRMKKPASFS